MCYNILFLIALTRTLILGQSSPLARQLARLKQTKSAHTGRRKPRDKIQAIIVKHTYALWQKKPAFLGNKAGTASEIRKAVMLEIEATMTELTAENELQWPKGWEPAEEKNKSDESESVFPLCHLWMNDIHP